MTYQFLFLSLLFLIPGALIYIFRKDLRPVIHLMALFSIPFAFTERLFYPDYWEPVFLFDLVNIIGFGIEDLLFVMGLAAFTSTAYAVVRNRQYERIHEVSLKDALFRGIVFLAVVFIGVGVLFLLEIEMIYGSVLIMLAGFCFVVARRKDLGLPGIQGAMISLLVYTFLCGALMMVYPSIFRLTWHSEKFLNIFILGIPLEEMLYAFTAGLIATVFYPYVFHLRFKYKRAESAALV